MAYTILSNKKNTSAVILITSNSTLTIAGNSTVSNVATGSEVLTGCSISQIFCGSNSGNAAYWVVKRGTDLTAILDSTGYFDYAGCGMALTNSPTATLVANLENSTTGYLLIEIQKQGTFTSDYFQS
jgi:hypothetical protein